MRPFGAALSSIAPGLGQMYAGRWFTGFGLAVLIPLCLGLLAAVSWNGDGFQYTYSYSHLFLVGAALFVLIVAAADAYLGATRPQAPCQRTCPAGVPIPDYLQLIIDEDFEQGHSLIRSRLPLVGVIGRICPHPCEQVCYRGVDGEPIAINACKRFLADRRKKGIKDGKMTPPPPPAVDSDAPSVAVVGAGPSGLACAFYLNLLGLRVSVYDAEIEPGGRLLTSIPEFRLPRAVLAEEVEDLARRGVVFHRGTRVGPGGIPAEKLLADHAAVYLSAGAGESRESRVPGEENFIDFQKFLRAAKIDEPMRLSGKVAVVGGGNAAIDVCRTALRCGAEEVHLLYRRSREEMPARDDEVEAAMREGIEFHYLVNPTRGVTEGGRLTGVEVVEMKLGAPDADGRPQPMPVAGSEHFLAFSTVIPCLGQTVGGSLFADPALSKLARESDGRVRVHPKTQRTSIRRLYAGGDAVRGADTAVGAIADGRRAALAIFADVAPERVKAPRARLLWQRRPFPGHVETAQEKVREEMRCIPLSTRSEGFEEVEEGFYPAQSAREAHRCLQCHREL